jgi:3-hydroxymyristoyl/3-hydroxydecanoyl-(acyl carrier protein) dehydratase
VTVPPASAEATFEADHPASRGHFAGNPIIPGAVLLNEAVAAIAAREGMPTAPLSVGQAKFPRPARPGDRVRIEYTRAGNEIRFTCTVAGEPVLAGHISCSIPPTTP